MSKTKQINVKELLLDVLVAIFAGLIVSVAYYFFQNSNGFAPGGVGGLATMAYYLLDYKIDWAYIMLAFNLPIFVLVTIFVNKKLGAILIIYIVVQSFGTTLWETLELKPYCQAVNGEDTRMNIPGKAKNNWRYRITKDQLNLINRQKFNRLNDLYSRKR